MCRPCAETLEHRYDISQALGREVGISGLPHRHREPGRERVSLTVNGKVLDLCAFHRGHMTKFIDVIVPMSRFMLESRLGASRRPY